MNLQLRRAAGKNVHDAPGSMTPPSVERPKMSLSCARQEQGGEAAETTRERRRKREERGLA